jgi:hypothetical protein
MKEAYRRKEVLARRNEVFIGIDVHKERWQVTVRTEGGEIYNGRLPRQCHTLERIIATAAKNASIST